LTGVFLIKRAEEIKHPTEIIAEAIEPNPAFSFFALLPNRIDQLLTGNNAK
jgi:hypothetical protein